MRLDFETGYLSDLLYTAGFYGELAPVHLNYVLAIRGADPAPLEKGFRYCELGCGRGMTLNVLAAANPNGEFHGIDFMPAHVADAMRLARLGGLDNVTFHEATFAEAARLDLPQFDFVALHGVYAWVTPEARKDIVEFLRRRLRPGGVAYISYNAMPGWAPMLPLRRFLVERAASLRGDGAENAAEALEWVRTLFALDGSYVRTNPRIKQFLDGLKDKPPAYVAHEYLNGAWNAFWFADVRDDLAGARLDFIGDAAVSGNYPELTLAAPWRTFLDGPGKGMDRETQKDFLLNVQFRKDVFSKGARRAESGQRFEPLRDFRYLARADTLGEELSFTALKLKLAPIHRAIFEAAQAADLQFDDLARIAGAEKVTLASAMGALQALVAGSVLQPLRGASQTWKRAPAARLALSAFNQIVVDQAITARQPGWLASQISGTAMALSTLDAVILTCLLREPDSDTAQLQQELARRNMSVLSEGKAVAEPDKLTELLSRHLASVRESTIPLLRRLGILQPVEEPSGLTREARGEGAAQLGAVRR